MKASHSLRPRLTRETKKTRQNLRRIGKGNEKVENWLKLINSVIVVPETREYKNSLEI